MPDLSGVMTLAAAHRVLLRDEGYAPGCLQPDCRIVGCWRRDGYDANGYDAEGYDRNGFDSEGYNRNGYDRGGDSRYDDDNDYDSSEDSRDDGYGTLLNYSYTPYFKFHGDKPPYYGMEIEVTTDHTRRLVDTVRDYAGDLIYCKEDGSVDGAELVTHPMSYEWAMGNFPWELLPALKDTCDATIIPSDNGIHIHVGRNGFTDPAHMFRWMKLWYRNPQDMQRIGRRISSHWGAFRIDERTGQAMHVKRDKPSYNRDEDTTRNARYAAINTVNRDTLEVRIFASTLRPRRAQAALQLVAGSVEYTRQLTAADVTQRRGWDWSAFIAWAGKTEQYPALIAENRVRKYRESAYED